MTYIVKDTIVLKSHYETNHEPGVVVVFDCADSAAIVVEGGRATVRLHTPEGRTFDLEVREVKAHGPRAASFFFSVPATALDIPIGTEVEMLCNAGSIDPAEGA